MQHQERERDEREREARERLDKAIVLKDICTSFHALHILQTFLYLIMVTAHATN